MSDPPETIGQAAAAAAHACVSLDLLDCGVTFDESIQHGLEDGLVLLDTLQLGQDSRSSSTFSWRTIQASKLLRQVESLPATRAMMPVLVIRRAQLHRVVMGEPASVDLLAWLRKLTMCLMVLGAKPMGCF